MGWMAAADMGTPAYQGNLNNNAVTIAEELKTAGYRTYMTGKWYLTNERKIDGMITDNWPVQRGFDRYFGIIPGGANYFTPIIYRFFLSDNGACAEFICSGPRKAADGKEDTFESYRIDWANLSSTPFKEYKHFTYEGGIATPLIVHWPAGIVDSLRNTFIRQYGHLTDIMATCVDVSGATYPTEVNGLAIHGMVGKSLVPHFAGRDNKRGKIFWEHEANIAMRDGKWKLVAKTLEEHQFDPRNLRLYNLEEDPIELTDLSSAEPERVQRMYAEWQRWGEEVGVFPLDTRNYGRRGQDYRRHINGDFNDNLGGWNVNIGTDANATVSIDTTGKLTGQKAARITLAEPDTNPDSVALLWPFRGQKGERFEVEINAMADKPSDCYLRLEQVGKNDKKVIDQEISVGTTPGSRRFVSKPLPADGQYRLALYFGGGDKGTMLWVDDVALKPVPND